MAMNDAPDDKKNGPPQRGRTKKSPSDQTMAPGQKPGSGRPDRQYRLDKMRSQSLKPRHKTMAHDASIDCGWGRLFFAQTFDRLDDVVEALRQELPQQRDIAFYLRDPHVALSKAPQELFLDPSHTYRLDLHIYQPSVRRFRGFHIRRLSHRSDIAEINRIYGARNMVLFSGIAAIAAASPIMWLRMMKAGHWWERSPGSIIIRPIMILNAGRPYGVWRWTPKAPIPASVKPWCGDWPSISKPGAMPIWIYR